MSRLDFRNQHVAEARAYVDPVAALDVVRVAFRPAPGCNERVEQRKPLVSGEHVESQARGDYTLTAVPAGEDRPCLSNGSALGARVETSSALAPVDVAEDDLEDDRALLGHTAIRVLSDPLAAAQVSRRFTSRHADILAHSCCAANSVAHRCQRLHRSGDGDEPSPPLLERIGQLSASEPLMHGGDGGPAALRVLLHG